MPDSFRHVANLQASERRFHPRQQVLYSLMLLDDDNGGVVLNISESGLALSAVQSLTEDPLHMRFQLSESSPWIEAQGRIAWTSASRKTVGVQFVGLPYEERIRIRRWLTSIDPLSTTAKTNLPTEIAPPVAVLEPASAVSTPEPATPAEVVEDSKQDAAPKEPTELPSIAAETIDVETISQYFGATADLGTVTDEYAPTEQVALEKRASAVSELANAVSASELEATKRVVENPEQDLVAKNPEEVSPSSSEARERETASGPTSRPPVYLSYEDAPPIGAKVDDERTRSRHSRRSTGVFVLLLVLVLLGAFFLGRHLRHIGISQRTVEVPTQTSQPALLPSEAITPKNPPVATDLKQPLVEVPAPASQPPAPPSESVTPKGPPVAANLKQPVVGPGFVLQVGAMTHKENADALVESLHGKNFPVFVSHHENDRFYMVLVGPYSDIDSAVRVKTDLKKEGIESIQRPWNPSVEQPPHSSDSK